MTTITSSNWSDKLERLVATALQSGLSVLVLTDCSTFRTAAIAVGAAALAGLKAWAKEVLDKRAA